MNSTIRYHLEQYRKSHPELLIDSFYVDNVVTGASTEEEAFQLYTDAKKILRDGAFNLRNLCVEWGSTNNTGTSMFKISHIRCEVKA